MILKKWPKFFYLFTFIHFLFYFLLCFSTLSFAENFPRTINADIMLLSMPCYLCQMIEGEEKIYKASHIALALTNPHNGQPYWIEAYGSKGVGLQTQKDFLTSLMERKVISTSIKIFHLRTQNLTFEQQKKFNQILWNVAQTFIGKKYDSLFVWEESKDQSKDQFYCSELVAKILNQTFNLLDLKEELFIKPKPMSFKNFYSSWKKYFAPHPVPEGKSGLTPEDLALSFWYQ